MDLFEHFEYRLYRGRLDIRPIEKVVLDLHIVPHFDGAFLYVSLDNPILSILTRPPDDLI